MDPCKVQGKEDQIKRQALVKTPQKKVLTQITLDLSKLLLSVIAQYPVAFWRNPPRSPFRKGGANEEAPLEEGHHICSPFGKRGHHNRPFGRGSPSLSPPPLEKGGTISVPPFGKRGHHICSPLWKRGTITVPPFGRGGRGDLTRL